MGINDRQHTFERHHYDQRAATCCIPASSTTKVRARGLSTSEGHNSEYDEAGHVVGMTSRTLAWLLDRDSEVTAVTLPAGHVSHDDLAQALQPAA